MIDSTVEDQEAHVSDIVGVRRELATQLNNVFLKRMGQPDPVALEMERNIQRPVLIVQAKNNEGVKVLEGESANYTVEKLTNEDTIAQLQQSALRHDDSHDLPEGARALSKKSDHASARRAKGLYVRSAFDELEDLPIMRRNVSEVSVIVCGIIDEVLKNPATVIETDLRTDVIGRSGKGVRFYRAEQKGTTTLSFAGFIDPFAYKH